MKHLIILLLLTGCSWKTDTLLEKVDTSKETIEMAWVPIDCPNNETVWLRKIKVKHSYEYGHWSVWDNSRCIEVIK